MTLPEDYQPEPEHIPMSRTDKNQYEQLKASAERELYEDTLSKQYLGLARDLLEGGDWSEARRAEHIIAMQHLVEAYAVIGEVIRADEIAIQFADTRKHEDGPDVPMLVLSYLRIAIASGFDQYTDKADALLQEAMVRLDGKPATDIEAFRHAQVALDQVRGRESTKALKNLASARPADREWGKKFEPVMVDHDVLDCFTDDLRYDWARSHGNSNWYDTHDDVTWTEIGLYRSHTQRFEPFGLDIGEAKAVVELVIDPGYVADKDVFWSDDAVVLVEKLIHEALT